jgi:DNA-directed RNA polymerase subunit H (RpoH/RPB5)
MNINQIKNNLNLRMAERWEKATQHVDLMMERRGFKFERQLDLLFFSYTNDQCRSIVCIFPNDKLSIETLREIIQFCENQRCRNVVLILQNVWSSNCKKIFENLTFFSLEIFYLKEFQYDLTSLYYFVPHEKLQDAKLLTEIKKTYGSSLPVLSKNDIVSRYYNFQKGDIIKITRNDFNIPTISYRSVK